MGTVPTIDRVDNDDIFLGAGICQKTPQTRSPVRAEAPELRTPNLWINGTGSGHGVQPMNSLIDLDSDGNVPTLVEYENGMPSRPRQANSGMIPIAENGEQMTGFIPEIAPDVTAPVNREQDWPMTTSSGTALQLSESLLRDLPPTAYPSPMPGPGSTLSEFPYTPQWHREDYSVGSLTVHQMQSIPFKSRLPFYGARTGCSIMEVATAEETGSVLQSRPPTITGSLRSHCSSSDGLRERQLRREQILLLSQNPLGPNTVLQGQSCPSNSPPGKFRSTSADWRSGNVTSTVDTPPPALNQLYSTYHSRPGIVRRLRRRLFRFGGKLCRNFVLWVVVVATFAGLEGFKDRSRTPRCGGVDQIEFVEWSDSDHDPSSQDTSNRQKSMFDAFSFKG
eukprot:g2196.t1